MYSKFSEDVEKLISEVLGEAYNVSCYGIPRNNDAVQEGLSIQKQGERIAPIIYLRPYFEDFIVGRELSDIVKELIEVYMRCYKELPESLPKFETFETAKEQVAYKLVRQSGNDSLLRDIPYTPYLDLALVYYLLVDSNEKGQVTVMIRNEHVKYWGITTEILYECAKENAPRLLPPSIRPILDVICASAFNAGVENEVKRGFLKELREERQKEASPFLVLSNEKGMYGAACMLYNGLLERFAEEQEADVIILPSSIHEMLLIPMREEIECEELQEMVVEVNKTLLEEDVLSEHVYLFERIGKNIKILL